MSPWDDKAIISQWWSSAEDQLTLMTGGQARMFNSRLIEERQWWAARSMRNSPWCRHSHVACVSRWVTKSKNFELIGGASFRTSCSTAGTQEGKDSRTPPRLSPTGPCVRDLSLVAKKQRVAVRRSWRRQGLGSASAHLPEAGRAPGCCRSAVFDEPARRVINSLANT